MRCRPLVADRGKPIGSLLNDVFFKLYFGLFQANEIINIKVRVEENTLFLSLSFFFRINEELFLATIVACDLQTF